jgi:tetratricopeptide (TPR) repeat protein
MSLIQNRSVDKGESKRYRPRAGIFWTCSCLAFMSTLAWCWYLGGESLQRASLALMLCLSSLAAGTLLGFIFTIFGDEKEPFGKIRDAMIAVVSGITGVGLGKASGLGQLIGKIHVFTPPSEASSWFSVLVVVVYFVAGFYFMYFARILALNPRLAEGRKALDLISASNDVSRISIKITERLSQSLLLGREFIEEIVDINPEERKNLHADLFSEEVNNFLDECEKSVKNSLSMQADVVAMAARLHYYRVYFEEEETELREKQEVIAMNWINRALMRDPTNPDLQIELADILGMRGRYDEATSIIERLERNEDSPQFIQQWTGYFLLFIVGRENDAIRHSLQFHDRFPDESDALFNASCGYAQLYSYELDRAKLPEIRDSVNRVKCLELLQNAIWIDSTNKKYARDHSDDDGSFKSLKSDLEFVKLTSEST